MEIVVLDGHTLNPGDLSWDGLGQFGTLRVYDRTPAGKISERIGKAEVVYTNKTPLSKEVLGRARAIRFIGVLATGYNIVDMDAAKTRGITVCNVPTYGTAAVAQYTFALLLELCHHVGAHADEVRKGAWTACEDFCFWRQPLVELAGKTMGFIGFGRIGQAAAGIAQALGMNALAFDSKRVDGLEGPSLKYVELDELFARSDVISLHCPLNEGTMGIINKTSIAKMKDGAILINTARGALVAEEDLAAALNSGKLGAAAVDVVSVEPIRGGNPLLGAKNCLITPHIAWAPKESRARLMDVAVDNLRRFLEGNPKNVVSG